MGTSAAKKEFTRLARSLLPADASSFNQGLMDFGALQCVPQNPSCEECPLRSTCNAYRTGRVALLPVKKEKTPVKEVHLSYTYIKVKGYTAIRRRGPGDIWQGLWEPYAGVLDGARLLRSGVKHQLIHRTLLADFYLLEAPERPALPEGYVWIPESELDGYAKPRLVEMLLEIIK